EQQVVQLQARELKDRLLTALSEEKKPPVSDSTSNGNLYRVIEGQVYDHNYSPLGFCTVVIYDPNGVWVKAGTQTDEDGYFRIMAPKRGVIETRYLGINKRKTYFSNMNWIEFQMNVSSISLDVVAIYEALPPKRTTFSGSIHSVRTRPISTFPNITDERPDWWPNSDRNALWWTNPLKNSKEKLLEMLQERDHFSDETSPQSALPLAASGLRRNFRDYAYWLPQLRTDRHGIATATVRLPDDITRWKTFALAVGPKRLTGQMESSLRSFKPLQAQLAMPRFLLWGDSTQLIGKVQNFQGGERSLKRQFALQADTLMDDEISLELSHLDTMQITAPEGDSLELTYLVRESGGYWDGEVRKLPLFLPGSEETEGHFLNLETDSSRSFSFDPTKGPLRLIAEANWLGVLQQEIDRLHRYRYLCNEQAASKLMAYLWEARICEQFEEPFEKEKQIQSLIRRLAKAQLKGGGWGWWAGNRQSDWITLHAARALLMAKADGHDTPINWQGLTEQLQYEVQRRVQPTQLSALILLHKLGETTDARRIVDSLRQDTALSLQHQLQLLQVQQRYGLPHSLDSLWSHRQSTIRGNPYWPASQERSRFSVENSLLAYDLLARAGDQDSSLRGVRNAFLERYQADSYLNTYQAARMLVTFLPAALAESGKPTPAGLQIAGDAQLASIAFPIDTLLEDVSELEVQRSGSGPLYLSLTQRWHNPEPLPKTEHFQVRSWLGAESEPRSQLEAGKKIQLQVEVEVLAESEYLLIEVPIPAGCSYGSKATGKHQREVHREYFREQVGIFCRKLSPGTYRFSVELMPRFSGTYTLNSPRVEPMYQPSLFGRGEMKQVVVK
ncbi:MAG: alpha-2-macroglobulin family protein, partial [Bacteroidota bacterium]